ncbi:MAG TPA: hypothetical protein VHZ74_23530 [Bryobacteraceae bacterium]|nr:hypothetical protein [Bryobacteraceae bacterium]
MPSKTLISVACAGLAALTALAFAERLEDTTYVPYGDKAIQYFETPTDEAVKRLDDKLDAGQAKLDFQPGGLGYLPALLKALGLNVDSQVLVHAADSFQSPLISPQRPRAVYFNDDLAVGFVQHGEVMEVSSLDPKQGVIFYTLSTGRVAKPSFARREVCLQCHQGGHTLGVPGLVISSQYVPPGMPAEHVRGGFVTDDRTPIENRWGGWYISGSLGGQKHKGVPIGSGPELPFDASAYLSPVSDIVALMTLEHQTRMTNLMIRIGWDTRIAMADGKMDEARPKLEAAMDDMLGYMLFTDEAPLTAPVKGVSTFSTTFPARGPRDKEGRSLRDFDLQKRLFKYPLSYMIYSKAFDGMPAWDRERIYQRLYDVLTGKNTDPKFAKLSSEDRRNVLEIMRETKANLPEYWKARPAQQP